MLKKRIKFLCGQEKEQKHNMVSRVEASVLLSFLSATGSGSQQSGSFWVKRDLKCSMRQEPGIKLCSKPGDGKERRLEKISKMQTTVRGQYVWESAGSWRLESKEPIKLPPPSLTSSVARLRYPQYHHRTETIIQHLGLRKRGGRNHNHQIEGCTEGLQVTKRLPPQLKVSL